MTRASVRRVPNQPKTPQRTVRVTDDLWAAARKHAAADGITVTDVVVRALGQYVAEQPCHAPDCLCRSAHEPV